MKIKFINLFLIIFKDVDQFINEDKFSISNLSQQVESAKLFSQNLLDITFDVRKTHNAWPHKKVKRKLRLAQNHIENLQLNNQVSSKYEYDRVIKVTISDTKTLVLEYKGAKHPYIYNSPVCNLV